MIAIIYILKTKGRCVVKLEVLNVPYSQELTAASLVKFSSSPLSFEHVPGRQKFQSQNFEKVQFLGYYFIFVTYLPSEVDERIISEIHFWMKMEYDDLRESRFEELSLMILESIRSCLRV